VPASRYVEPRNRDTHRKVQSDLAWKYIKGKANKDWWFREVGWWEKNAVFIAEEFLAHVTPLCFIQLFGKAPQTHFVRHVFDNGYTESDYEVALASLKRGFEIVPGGVTYRAMNS